MVLVLAWPWSWLGFKFDFFVIASYLLMMVKYCAARALSLALALALALAPAPLKVVTSSILLIGSGRLVQVYHYYFVAPQIPLPPFKVCLISVVCPKELNYCRP